MSRVAVPLLTFAVPRVVRPSEKVTGPRTGAPLTVCIGATVAVRWTFTPEFEGLRLVVARVTEVAIF